MPSRSAYERVAHGIARYLAERQRPNGTLPGPSSYGVAFALWLWSHFGAEFALPVARAWRHLEEDPPRTHVEFNAYALLNCRARLGPGPTDAFLSRLSLRGRHSANWMLLRAACRAAPGPWLCPILSTVEARAALLRYGRGGLIHDRPGVRSLAYHAFSGALLADLWRLQRLPWAGRRALLAARFLLPFVLANGDALYIGRGQRQIFGCGALLYLLEAAGRLSPDPAFPEAAGRVLDHLLAFRRPDHSFPLVLRGAEPPEPWAPDPALPGWYSYNRYADYLPFLACMLLRAADPDLPPLPPSAAAGAPHADPAFRIHRQPRYTAVLARPGGHPANDLPFPYACVDGESLFPCYGAEADRARPEDTPLPCLVMGGRLRSFRDLLCYRLTDSGLVGRSPLGAHVREFDFRDDGFTCRDRLRFARRLTLDQLTPANFLFRTLRRGADGALETWHRSVVARLRITPPAHIVASAGATATGRLVALRHTLHNLRLCPGDALSIELDVQFLSPW